MKLALGIALFLLASSMPVAVLPALMPPAGMVRTHTAGSGGQGAATVTGLHPLFLDVPFGGYPHDTYGAGQCTWWAAYNRQVPPYLGDGGQWFGSAAAAGIPTSQEPSVGAIVSYRSSPGYDTVHGHVAIVIGVGPASFRVSEMNYAGLGVVDERDSPWPDWHVAGFIPK
jgi:hypothetical protein